MQTFWGILEYISDPNEIVWDGQLIHLKFRLILSQPKYLKMLSFKLLFAALALMSSSSLLETSVEESTNFLMFK